jgi:hypothetical protein
MPVYMQDGEQRVLKIGLDPDAIVMVRSIIPSRQIPNQIIVSVPSEVEDSPAEDPSIEIRLLSYFTLAGARQRLREIGELS